MRQAIQLPAEFAPRIGEAFLALVNDEGGVNGEKVTYGVLEVRKFPAGEQHH
jgi:hypothetical protein